MLVNLDEDGSRNLSSLTDVFFHVEALDPVPRVMVSGRERRSYVVLKGAVGLVDATSL